MALRRAILFLLPVLLCLAYLNLSSPFFVERFRNTVFDTLQTWAEPQTGTPSVITVEIDEASVRRMGPWPWPREHIGWLIEALADRGAQAIILALLLRQPDPTDAAFDTDWMNPLPAETRESLGLLPNGDAALAASISGRNVVTGYLLLHEPGWDVPTSKSGVAVRGSSPTASMLRFAGAVDTIPELVGAAEGNGSFNIVPDNDGVVRRMPMVLNLNGSLVPSVMAEALRVAQGASTYLVSASSESKGQARVSSVRVGNLLVPTDATGRVILRFGARPASAVVPAWQVLDGSVDPGLFEGSIVVLGTSIHGVSRVHATPVGQPRPGNEIIARTLDAALSSTPLLRPDWAIGAETVAGVLTGLLLIVILVRTGPAIGLAAAVVIIVGAWATAVLLFREADRLFDANPVIVAALATYLGVTFLSYLQTEREIARRQVAEGQALASEEEANKARYEAELANRAKSDFLARMSHEIRTPLNAIIGFAEMIRDEAMGAVQPPAYRDYAGDIHGSASHLLNLINDLLDLSKIEAGKMELQEELVDLADTARSCLSLVRERASRNGVELQREAAADLPPLVADERSVRQMLLNLLSNAIAYTPSGRGATVRVFVGEDGGLVMQVADQGIGIAPEDMPRVLSPYGQVDNVWVRERGGTGLGVPLVRSLIELHGGRFEIESAPDVGTTVTLHFPPSRTVRDH